MWLSEDNLNLNGGGRRERCGQEGSLATLEKLVKACVIVMCVPHKGWVLLYGVAWVAPIYMCLRSCYVSCAD